MEKWRSGEKGTGKGRGKGKGNKKAKQAKRSGAVGYLVEEKEFWSGREGKGEKRRRGGGQSDRGK